MTDKRKKGQSQLDYLWTTFGNLEISNESTSSDEVLLTGKAITELVNKKQQLGDKANIILDTKFNKDIITLFLKDSVSGGILSQVDINLGIINNFDKFISNDQDVINGLVSRSGVLCIKLKDSLNKEFILELFSGSETNTIQTYIENNRITSNLKINNSLIEKDVELKQSSNGIQANLVVSELSPIKVNKTRDGILIHQTWEDENIDLKHKFLTYNEYSQLENKDEGTIYYLTDRSYFYFRNRQYGGSAQITDDYYNKDEVNNLIPKISIMSVEDTNKLINQIFK